MAEDLNPEWGLVGHGAIAEKEVMMILAPEMVKVERAHMQDHQKICNIRHLTLNRTS